MNALTFACSLILLVACNNTSIENREPDSGMDHIVLRHDSDKFLKNFVSILNGKLIQTISYDEAIRAGATANGYYDFVEQLATINRSIKSSDLDMWSARIKAQIATTIQNNYNTGSYDKYNVSERDKFLEYFVSYTEDSGYMNITQERALLLGATSGGYFGVSEGLKDLLGMVAKGEMNLDVWRQQHSDKLNKLYIEASNAPGRSAATRPAPPEDRPSTIFSTIQLFGYNHNRT